MKAKVMKNLGIFFFLIGVVLILNSLSGITGFIIAERVGTSVSGILGLVFLVVGVLLFVSGLEKKVKPIKIIRTKQFQKAIKRHPQGPIEAAIKKIGTGLANEENLKYAKGNSIRTTKGGRVFYIPKGKTIELIGYTPDHKYARG